MKPDKIYKYQPMNNYSLANLKNKQVWFSSTNDFNDPFELRCLSGNNSSSKIAVMDTGIQENVKGVTCFSEVYDNILMWAYYGDKHRGFCLEFSTKAEMFGDLYKVKYSDTYPIISSNSKESEKSIINGMLTKSRSWSYEKEWRLLHAKYNFGLPFNEECLTGIYFGVKMDSAYKEIISLIVRSSSVKTVLYEGYLDESLYSIGFKQI